MQNQSVAIIRLGCDKNDVDADVMAGLLQQAGYSIEDDLAKAEVIIVNTCGFINPAKEESIQHILQASEYKAHGSCKSLIVSGCLSQRYYDDLLQELPEVDAFMGTGSIDQVVKIVQKALNVHQPSFVDFSRPQLTKSMNQRRIQQGEISAFVKIAEGCNNSCSYCIIPQLRGGYESRTIEDIEDEVRLLSKEGTKEINLVAQDTSNYGIDLFGRSTLAELLQRLLAISGPRWFRLLYCYPTHIDDQLINLMAKEDRIASYLDIPLQHSHPKILESMKRPGIQKTSTQWLTNLRKSIPNLTLRTTMIVGFPGETQEEFGHLLNFIKDVKFDHLGVFKYSQEEGTPAAAMEGQVPEKVKQKRFNQIMEEQQMISWRRNQRFLGHTIPIMLEHPSDNGLWVGRGEKDAPGVDGLCYVSGVENGQRGQIISVKITEAMEYDLRGVRTLNAELSQ